MIYIAIATAWLYLFLWFYSFSTYKLNKCHLATTIMLVVILGPIFLVCAVCALTINIIFFILSCLFLPFRILFKSKRDIFYNMANDFNHEIKKTVLTYLLETRIISFLCIRDANVDYFYLKDISFFTNYVISMKKIGAKDAFIETVFDDFIEKINKGMGVLEWIEQDEYIFNIEEDD